MADLSSYINITANTVTSNTAVSTTGNVVASNVSVSGNVTGNYILGNGSQLTGIVSSYGNSNVATLLGAFGSNAISTTGTVTAGNITGGNVLTSGQVSATGNATFNAVSLSGSSGNITGADQVLANAFSASGNVTSGGLTVFGSAIITGNTTVQGTLTYNNLTNITTPNLVFGLANTSTGISANGAGFVVGNTNQATFLYNYGTTAWNSNIGISAVGNLTGANILTGGQVSATGNITGGYIIGNGSQLTGLPAGYTNSNVTALLAAFGSNTISTTGTISSGNVTGANILTGGSVSATGNITGAYIIGNGSQLTGVTAYTNANTAAFLAAFGSNTISTTGSITSGNITGGNVLTGGIVSATGNITGGNIAATNHTGTTVSVSGNVSGGNVLTGGIISATGNITGGNISVTNIVGTLTTAAQNNITSVGTLSSLSVTATVTGGNVATAGTASATGNITGGNILTAGIVSSTGNITGGNISATNHTGTTVSVSGNITAGNIATAGQVSATGNITTANSFVGNLVGTTASMTGNVYAGNVIVNGQPTTYGYVNPGYVNVGLTNAINGIGSGSTLIYDATLKSNGTAVTYNTGTGVFTLTAGVTYNLMATGSWYNFSDVTNGYIVYAWVDATTGTRLDTTGNSDGIAEPLNRPVNEFNATAAELIYTPVTNQTVKVNVVAAGGTVAMRGGIGSKAIVTQINPTIAVQATATGTVATNYAKYTRTASQSVSANSVIICNVAESSSGTAVSVNTSTGQVTLTAGTYRLRGTAGTIVGSAASSSIAYGWYNETTSAWVGEGASWTSPSSTNWNSTTSGTAEYVITVASTTVVSFRVIAVSNVTSIGGNQSDFAGTYANPWIDIEQIGSTFALNALDTMTTTGNVTVGGNLSVSGNVAGTLNVTAPVFHGVTPDWGLNDSATAAWFLLGTWNTSQAGNCLYMRLLAHCGYNAVANQNQVTELMFVTSNNSSYIAGSTGNFYAAGSASVNSRLGTGGTSPSYQAPVYFRIVQVSTTQYQVYAYFGAAYMRNSNYSIQITPGDTWTDGGGSAVSAPGGNYITITPSSF